MKRKGLNMEKISVILVNYNGKKYNDKCIESILRSTISSKLQIVVVDNASTDNSLQLSQDRWRENNQVTIIPLDKNYGFSEANNVGIKWSEENGYEYFFILNNDTEIRKDTVEKMLDSHKETGAIVVPKIVYADKPDTIWYAGGYFSKVIWKPLPRGMNQKDAGQYNRSEQCSFANGCSLFMSKEIIQKLGILDEKFFLYYEDVEYSLRARKKQVTIWYCAEALVYHKVNGATFGNERPDSAYYIARNWLICNQKWMSKGRFALFLCYFVFNRVAWIMIWIVRGQLPNIFSTIDAIKDYKRDLFGQYPKNSL